MTQMGTVNEIDGEIGMEKLFRRRLVDISSYNGRDIFSLNFYFIPRFKFIYRKIK